MSEKLSKPLLEFNVFSLFIDAVLCALVYFLDGVTTADKTKSVFVLATLIAVPLTAIMFVLVTKHLKKCRITIYCLSEHCLSQQQVG